MSVLKFVIFVGSLFLTFLFLGCVCLFYFILFMNMSIANKIIYLYGIEKGGEIG